ncbi:MAG: AtpZ/AtpI family protein [Candidatus Saccharimonadales bacterium]
MKKTTTPTKTPSPDAGHSQVASEVGNIKTAKAEFVSATLNMSWQLALVVLIPIIGGFELDKKLNMTPLLTIVGFFIAMIGMGVVVWKQFQLVTPKVTPSNKGPKS